MSRKYLRNKESKIILPFNRSFGGDPFSTDIKDREPSFCRGCGQNQPLCSRKRATFSHTLLPNLLPGSGHLLGPFISAPKQASFFMLMSNDVFINVSG